MEIHYNQKSFEDLIVMNFGFVVSEAKMTFDGVRISGGKDPRDATLVARYSSEDFRLDVGWNEHELSLAILLKFMNNYIPHADRYVYFEPLMEFLTHGEEKAVVPYITEGMTINHIERIAEERQVVFQNGLSPVVEKIGIKFRLFWHQLESISDKQIQDYHQWIKSKR